MRKIAGFGSPPKQLKVSENFSLKEFVEYNDAMPLLEKKASSLPRETALAIHKFHRYQNFKGKRKNQGPIRWPGMESKQKMGSEYFNRIRDPKIAAAISQTHKILNDSLDFPPEIQRNS